MSTGRCKEHLQESEGNDTERKRINPYCQTSYHSGQSELIPKGKSENNIMQPYTYLNREAEKLGDIYTHVPNSHWLINTPRVFLISQHFWSTVQERAEQAAVVEKKKALRHRDANTVNQQS